MDSGEDETLHVRLQLKGVQFDCVYNISLGVALLLCVHYTSVGHNGKVSGRTNGITDAEEEEEACALSRQN